MYVAYVCRNHTTAQTPQTPPLRQPPGPAPGSTPLESEIEHGYVQVPHKETLTYAAGHYSNVQQK